MPLFIIRRLDVTLMWFLAMFITLVVTKLAVIK